MDVTTKTMINGVDVTALMDTIEAVQGAPAIADFQFRAANRWMGGDRNRSSIESFSGACSEHAHDMGPFEIENAEPPVLLGGGTAPNPVEYVLHALAGCLTTTMVYHAAARGIRVDDVSSSLEGDLDLRGFLGLDPSVRKGFSAIRVHLRVKAEASGEQMAALAKYSPVFDIVSNSLPVEVTVEMV